MGFVKDSFSASTSRSLIYGLANLCFLMFVLIAEADGPSSAVRPLYLILLFAVCSSPLLVLRQLNDRYACYGVFLVCYFLSFGALDCIALASGKVVAGSTGEVISEAELLILAGAIAFSAGYLRSAALGAADGDRQILLDDWSMSSLVVVGWALWLGGTIATWYWNIKLTVRVGEFHNATGGFLTSLLMIGRYVQPLGLMIIAYAYVMSRSSILMVMTIVAVCCQMLIGFVSDTKELGMVGGILVILTATLVRSKPPKGWVMAGVLFIVFGFPVFQAHRSIVVYEHGMTNDEGLQNIGKSLQLSWDNQERAAKDVDAGSQSFFDRASVKGSVEMIVSRTGHDVPFQYGHTLLPLVLAFVPRLLWEDKVDVQTGQLLNQQFNVTGNSVTYISCSHLGDWYWNFGWFGATLGMLASGLLLGWINRRCDLSRGVSASRVLVIALSMYELCARFEGSISNEYAVWIRSLVGILLLHWLFARKVALADHQDSSVQHSGPGAAGVPVGFPAAQFPNLLH
jgi:hypothetical protein